MDRKTIAAMSMALLAATQMSQPSDAQNTATDPNGQPQPQLFTLDNSVSGGKEFANYYPYGMSSWVCELTDDILFYNPQRTLCSLDAKGNIVELCSFADLQKLANGHVSIIKAVSPTNIWVWTSDGVINLDPKTQTIIKRLDAECDDVTIAPNNTGFVAYTQVTDLYVWDGQTTRCIGKASPEDKSSKRFGQTVHRNEFGIGGGMFWSPNGQRLCYYAKDETMVTNYPLVDVTSRTAHVVNSRYPMAGETSEQVEVRIYDMTSGTSEHVCGGTTDDYYTNISWSTDSRTLSLAKINRDQNHMWFNIFAIDANATAGLKVGKEVTLFEETDSAWIEPCEPALWLSGNSFVWLSYRNGFRHLYRYDLSPKGDKAPACKQLTDGQWCVTALLGHDKGAKNILLQTNARGYLYRDICSVNATNGKMLTLSPDKTYSAATYGNNHTWVAINQSSANVAKEWVLKRTDGKAEKTIKTNANPYEGFAMPRIETVDLMSDDGQHPLTGRIILPTNFDPNKKYPVMVYVYGGPHSQLVDGSWLYGAGPWKLFFAQEGYIVFTMDNRGTEMRGSAFEEAVHRQLGVCEMEDQMVGVRYLQSLPYVDKSRIGVHGWSFGGFMTISLMTTYPDVFCAGVAGGPVCDWKYYEVMYGERYMDTPQQNPEGYEKTSLLNKIGNLEGRLLVIHGAMDSTVVWQHSQQLLNAAIEKGKFIDYMVYPNHPHNVIGKDRPHLMGYIKRYFDDWVKRQ